MSIEGLTDLSTRRAVGLNVPEFGRLYKGDEKRGNKPGDDLDYLRIEWNPAWDVARRVFESFEWVQAANGEIDKIEIYFLHPTPDQVFPTWFELWRGNNTLARRCDGCTVQRHLTESGRYDDTERPCMCDPAKRDHDDRRKRTGQCDTKGRLFFTIPALNQAVGIVGQFVLPLQSRTELREISGNLQLVYDRRGSLMRVPFMLLREPRTMTYERDGQRVKQDYSLVNLIPPERIVMRDDSPALDSPTDALPEPKPELPESSDTWQEDEILDVPDAPEPEPEPDTPKQTTVTVEKMDGLCARHFGGETTLQDVLFQLETAGIDAPGLNVLQGQWETGEMSLYDTWFLLCRLFAEAGFKMRVAGITPKNEAGFYQVYIGNCPIRVYGAGGKFQKAMNGLDLSDEMIADITAAIRDDEPTAFESRFGWESNEWPYVSIQYHDSGDDRTPYFTVEEFHL